MKVCKTCLSSTSCQTCFSTGNLTANGSVNICTCAAGLFFDKNTKSCKTCTSLFSNCQICDYNGIYNPTNPPNIICLQAKPTYYVNTMTGNI